MTEFETSSIAWDYMVQQNDLDNGFLYSIPYNNPRFVTKTPKPKTDTTVFTAKRIYVASDYMGEGVKGLQCMADGKQYDSKSEYYKAVKAAGCEVMGNDAPRTTSTEIKGDFVTHKDVADTIKQLGG
jgi:hypothetical protein